MHGRLVGFLIFSGILLLLDYYVFQGIKVVTRDWTTTSQRIFTGIYWGFTLFIFSGFLLVFTGFIDRSNPYLRLIFFGGLILNYFPKLVLLLFLVLDDVRRLFTWIWNFISPATSQTEITTTETAIEATTGITRSDFIVKTGLVVASLPLVATAHGIISGAYDYKVRRHILTFPNLPKAFDGIRIGQLSDIHSGSFFNKTAVEGGVDMLLAEKPDVIFFTGDLVNDMANEVQDYFPIFSKIKAPLGVYSVLGNHDYGDYVAWNSLAAKKKNLQDLKDAHKLLNWDLLLNENKKLKVGNDEIGLIGVENWGLGFVQHGQLDKAYAGTENLPFKILLSHDPTHWDAQIRPQFGDIDLTLSGHTHGMQFGIQLGDFEWSPSQWRYKQWGGLYTENNQKLYVNRGFGFIGLPGRIGMPPEITILELRRG